jgi:hypothetical protein
VENHVDLFNIDMLFAIAFKKKIGLEFGTNEFFTVSFQIKKKMK